MYGSMLLAAACGIAVALVVVNAGVRDTAASRAYVDQPAYAVWGGLVLLQVPLWALLGVASAWWAVEVRDLPPNDDRPAWQVVALWLGAAAAVGALTLVQPWAMPLAYVHQYPDHLFQRLVPMGAIAAFASAVPAVALWGITRAATAVDPAEPDAIERFARLWSRQRALLAVLGIILASVILTTAAKFKANNDFEPPPNTAALPQVPASYILVQGVWYGATLLALYLPPYLATRHVGEELVRKLCPSRSADETISIIDRWSSTSECRQKAREALGIAESTRQHVERGIILLAPLLTALVTTLVPDLKL